MSRHSVLLVVLILAVSGLSLASGPQAINADPLNDPASVRPAETVVTSQVSNLDAGGLSWEGGDAQAEEWCPVEFEPCKSTAECREVPGCELCWCNLKFGVCLC